MRQVRVLEQWVPTTEPHVVGEGVLAQPRAPSPARFPTASTHMHSLVPGGLGIRNAALVQQDQVLAACRRPLLLRRRSFDPYCGGLELAGGSDEWPRLSIAAHCVPRRAYLFPRPGRADPPLLQVFGKGGARRWRTGDRSSRRRMSCNRV